MIATVDLCTNCTYHGSSKNELLSVHISITLKSSGPPLGVSTDNATDDGTVTTTLPVGTVCVAVNPNPESPIELMLKPPILLFCFFGSLICIYIFADTVKKRKKTVSYKKKKEATTEN